MSETRQRWRLVFSRGEDARFLSHLDAVKLWERAFRRGSIPIATSEGLHPRPRLIFAAPLPLGMLAERELADVFLSERLTLADFRGRLERDLPRGYGLVDLYDEWIGAPALATQLVAADYRMTLLGATPMELAAATGRLLASDRLDREKRREARKVAYDLRPLVIALRTSAASIAPFDASVGANAAAGPEPSAGLWMRLRHSQDLGSGRPEEVVAALGEEIAGAESTGAESGGAEAEDAAGRPRELELIAPVRERLWLANELRDPPAGVTDEEASPSTTG